MTQGAMLRPKVATEAGAFLHFGMAHAAPRFLQITVPRIPERPDSLEGLVMEIEVAILSSL